MVSTLNDPTLRREYDAVLETLDKGGFWSREWAAHQYLGYVITAMCHAVVDDDHDARRFAVLRVLEVFLEDRYNLLPATGQDRRFPRQRVATLAIPNFEEQCTPWIDILEYMQLMNWTRKGLYQDDARASELRAAITKNFSEDLMAEINTDAETWWVL